MLPRHTWMACQAKYRLVKNKEGRSGVWPMSDAPAVAKKGQSNDAQVARVGMEAARDMEDKDETSSANTSSRNELQPVTMDIDDHYSQSGGKNPTVAASSNAGEAEQDVGGYPVEEPTTENTE